MSARQRPRAERPAPRLTHWGVALVRACYTVTDGQKLVLELHAELDRGDGVFMSPALMAQQLGMGLTVFKEHRVALQRMGLLMKREAPGSRLDLWFPCLPAGFEDAPPHGASLQERREWVRYWADRLKTWIEERRQKAGSGCSRTRSQDPRPSAGQDPTGQDPSPHGEGCSSAPGEFDDFADGVGNPDLERSEIPTSLHQLRSEFPEASVGKPDLSEHEKAEEHAPSVTLKAVGQRVVPLQLDSVGTPTGRVSHDRLDPEMQRLLERYAAAKQRATAGKQEGRA